MPTSVTRVSPRTALRRRVGPHSTMRGVAILAMAGAAVIFSPALPLAYGVALHDPALVAPASVVPSAPAGASLGRAQKVEDRAAAYIPADAIVAFRLVEPDARLGGLRSTLSNLGFFESPAGQFLMRNPGLMQARVGFLGLASASGMDGWTAAKAVLGQDAMLGLYPGRGPNGQNGFVIAAVPRDAQAQKKFLDSVLMTVGISTTGPKDPNRVFEINGSTAYMISPEFFLLTEKDAVIATNSRELLTAASAARAEGKSITTTARYEQATGAVPTSAAAYVIADAPKLAAAINAKAPDGQLGKIDNPVGGLLFGAWAHDLAHSDKAVAWVEDLAGGLNLVAQVESSEELPASFRGFVPKFQPGEFSWPSITLPRQIAEISIARGWSDLFAERESILALPAASQLANFSGVMTTLMGQVDFLEEVLPRINGPIRFFAARQEFTGEKHPSPMLPGFALVAPLKGSSDATFSQRLFSGGQMALSFINFDRAQKQKPGFLLGMAEHRGVKILKAEYAPPGTAKPAAGETDPAMQPQEASRLLPIEYNFAPASTVVKDHYIVATSLPMLTSMIDAMLDAKSEAKAPVVTDRLAITGDQVSEALRENRDELVAQRMLEQDESRQVAEFTVDAILSAAGFVDSLQVTSTPSESGSRAEMTLRLKAPRQANDAGAGGGGK